MKKSTPQYLITFLMLVLFTTLNFLPYFTSREKQKNCYSSEKEKTEKESREKDNSGENEYKEYITGFHLLRQNEDYFSLIDIRYADHGSSSIQTFWLPVFTPPPDSA